MIQSIITAIIVFVAAFIVVRNMLGKSASKKKAGCGGCASECGTCSIVDLKKEIQSKRAIPGKIERTWQ